VIEFNDGSLDLPRAKAKPKETVEAAVPAADKESKDVAPEMSAAEKEERVEAGAPPADEKETVEAGVPPANESVAPPKETEDVLAAGPSGTGILSAAEPNEQTSAAANTSTNQEVSEIGGS
jgi:hypothetical protein